MPSFGKAKEQAVTKFSKTEVDFEHPARGESHCADCIHFQGRSAKTCAIVAGDIEPGDWCKKYKEKS